MDLIIKKHICFFIGDLSNKGGTEKMTVSLANGLTDMGYSVSIISITPIKNMFFEIDSRVQTISILSKRSSFVSNYFKIYTFLRKFIKDNNIEILINVDVILALFSLPLKIELKSLKIVSWEHFNFKTNLGIKRRDWSRFLSKRYADAIITLTPEDCEFYTEDSKCSALVISIPNFLEKKAKDQSLLNKNYVLSVGRFSYQKGFDILVNLWDLVKKNSISEGWTLRIIGDGEMKEKIEKMVLEKGLNNSIEIIDATPNISDYYLNSSIYVMTSRYEGLPMVLLEAQSYGLPIVAFNCLTGPSSIIKENNNGFLINMNNVEQMRDRLLFLMKDEQLRFHMGDSSFKASSRYDKNNILKEWSNFFISLDKNS